MPSSAAQTSNESAGKFRMTLVVPPNSLNSLTITTGSAAYYISQIELLSASPPPFPNGTLDWAQSVTDWITSNSNYTQWTFNVKPGLRWSNGENVTSNDILTTFGPKFVLNPQYDLFGLHTEVQNEYALNSSAAVFDLNASDAHFSEKLCSCTYSVVYPASVIDSQGANFTYFGTGIADGPFYVSNYTSGSFQMVMLRNPYYTPQPAISEIDVSFVDSLSLTTSYLVSGSTDIAPIEPTNAQAVLNNPNLRVFDNKAFDITTLEYNDTAYPYNMTAFRQALAFGINQTQIVSQAFNGYALTAYNSEGIVSPTSSVWYNPNITMYNYNQTKSVALLQSIGITKGSEGLMHYPNGTVVSLGLWADTDLQQDVIAVGIVRSLLTSLGFQVNLQTTSAASIIGDYSSGLNNVRSGMILYTSRSPIFGYPYLDTQPGWNVYWLPTVANVNWEYPPNLDAQYQSNLSAFDATNNVGLEKTYLNNIQSLNSKSLPTLVLAYPDEPYGYNIHQWTNWPMYFVYQGSIFNQSGMASLQVSGGPAPGTSMSLTTIAVVAAIAVIAVIGILIFVRRRQRK
ncbi:MAG: ABC transporter substrate-binding protein [Nitrososphaerales archaeon]